MATTFQVELIERRAQPNTASFSRTVSESLVSGHDFSRPALAQKIKALAPGFFQPASFRTKHFALAMAEEPA
jgi:hypothetical protein